MRWNTMRGDIPRVCALADLLMGAAMADRRCDDDEWVAVASTLVKVLGVAELPDEVTRHMRDFDLDRLDVAAAIVALRLDGPRDRKDLMKVLARVVLADREVHEAERAYFHAVGSALDVSREDVDAMLEL